MPPTTFFLCVAVHHDKPPTRLWLATARTTGEPCRVGIRLTWIVLLCGSLTESRGEVRVGTEHGQSRRSFIYGKDSLRRSCCLAMRNFPRQLFLLLCIKPNEYLSMNMTTSINPIVK